MWDALADMPEDAANLRAHLVLMGAIVDVIAAKGWTQAEAALHSGVTQPRINDLLCGCVTPPSLTSGPCPDMMFPGVAFPPRVTGPHTPTGYRMAAG